MEQHKTDTSTWWEDWSVEIKEISDCWRIFVDVIMWWLFCLWSSSTICCYTACLNSDWWDRSSASERGLTSLAWRCSSASHFIRCVLFFHAFYSFWWVQIQFPLFLDLRCKRMWSRTFLTRLPSLASSVHWSCKPGKDIWTNRLRKTLQTLNWNFKMCCYCMKSTSFYGTDKVFNT